VSLVLIKSPPQAKENHMIISPQWKEVEKDKWVDKKDFDLTTCYFRGKKCRDPWPVVPIGINIGDTYTDGVEVVGDLSKKRKKELEVSLFIKEQKIHFL